MRGVALLLRDGDARQHRVYEVRSTKYSVPVCVKRRNQFRAAPLYKLLLTTSYFLVLRTTGQLDAAMVNGQCPIGSRARLPRVGGAIGKVMCNRTSAAPPPVA